jgi:hypothetical protein
VANPIVVPAGAVQKDVDPNSLLPSRSDLNRPRLDLQRQLLAGNITRFTPIQVNLEGIIWDGHHGARAAAEKGRLVDVLVIDQPITASGIQILALPVRG